MKISEQTILAAREADLVSIISQFTDLKKEGNQYKGLCPFHEERTPSFTVHSTKGYKCFGCDFGGHNAIDFIMELENRSFMDAVLRVCTLAGINARCEEGYKLPEIIKPIKRKTPPAPPIDYIPAQAVINNMEAYSKNNLYIFFYSLFGEERAMDLFTRFGVGSCNYFGPGTTLFMQMDINKNARQLKAILYDPQTGKRRKEREYEPKIMGRKILAQYSNRNYDDVNLQQCFFNEHELAERPKDPVAIVESEKSAMIASVYFPDMVWLATGGKSGCSWYSKEVCQVLKGREILLYPDVDAEIEWLSRIEELRRHTGSKVALISMVDLVQTGMEKFDIADFLLLNNKKQIA